MIKHFFVLFQLVDKATFHIHLVKKDKKITKNQELTINYIDINTNNN